MSSLPFPSTLSSQRQAPIVVKLPTVLLEQIGNYLGSMPWKLVHQLRPSLSLVLSGQPGKEEVQIDKALLDASLELLVEQPYDKVGALMYLINSWITYINTPTPQPQESTDTLRPHHV